MSTRLSAIFARAADLTEQGWCQGQPWETRDGVMCYCTWGAISKAIRDTGAIDDQQEVEAKLWNGIGLDPSISIGSWNDSPERTQAEVVALLRKLAEEQNTPPGTITTITPKLADVDCWHHKEKPTK